MERDVEEILLQKCLSCIEAKLNWGSSTFWATRDFEALSEKIYTETNVNLSVATLKRLWGKMKYDNKPTTTTLNTIAQFVGYENWRSFSGMHPDVVVDPSSKLRSDELISQNEGKASLGRSKMMILIIVMCLSGLGIAYFVVLRQSVQALPKGVFEFTSQKVVTSGIPNSVLFEYDASSAKESDTIFIQQSWDARLRQQVSRNDKSHNSIYYYPGFFQAKLVVNNKIVKEHDLFIKTNGWLPLIEQPGVPVYFDEATAKSKGEFRLSLKDITSKNIALQPQTPWVAYYNVRDFGDITCGNFLFETTVKNNYSEGSGVCQHVQIQILYEGSIIAIPLSIKGCVSSLKPYPFTPSSLKLASLGCDFSNWITVKCSVLDGKGTVHVNNESAFEFTLPSTSKKIVGLLYRFQGTGSIKSVKISKPAGESIFEENF